jgi:hypothetical protein
MIALTFSIALFSAVSAVVLLTGPTHDPTKIHAFKGLTPRGWFAAGLMGLTCVLGLAKEWLQEAKERRADAEKVQSMIDAARDKAIIAELRDKVARIDRASEGLSASNQALAGAVKRILKPINAYVPGSFDNPGKYALVEDGGSTLLVRGGDVLTFSYYPGPRGRLDSYPRVGPDSTYLEIEGIGIINLWIDYDNKNVAAYLSGSFLVPSDAGGLHPVSLVVGQNGRGGKLAISVQRADPPDSRLGN